MTAKSPDSLTFSPAQRVAAALYLWRHQLARDKQLPPAEFQNGDKRTWLIKSGRGFGKTRTGAEWSVEKAVTHDKIRVAVVAPTFADGRDVCFEGESGIVAVAERYGVIKHWNRSMGDMMLTNGSRLRIYSAEEPQRLRGPQHHLAWCDELAAWSRSETWDMLVFGLRLEAAGLKPQAVVTTTPSPTALFLRLLSLDSTVVTSGSTRENAENLSAEFLNELESRYGGTRLYLQEVLGEVLTDVPGALWTYQMIEEPRVVLPPELKRIVVAVDPAVTSGEESDETGIVAAGLGEDHRGYVLEDASGRMSTFEWARKVLEVVDRWKADEVVVETNQGGDAWEDILHAVRPAMMVTPINARRGKFLRARPVSSLYEQGRISHVGAFRDLEAQMTTWTEETQDQVHDDRLDALVHALTALDIGLDRSGADSFFDQLQGAIRTAPATEGAAKVVGIELPAEMREPTSVKCPVCWESYERGTVRCPRDATPLA